MDYNVLGKTGLNVSSLSFGASSLGNVFRPIDEAEGIRAVHAALDAGINYFDVAPAYGGTVAETVLGKALRDVSRDRYYLSTKAGKYTAPGAYGEDDLDYTERRIRAELQESMRRLGTDYVDILHLHDFEYQGFSKTELAFSEGFPALSALKNEGLIGSVSAGIYPMDLWQRVVQEVPVDAIMVHNHYSLIDTRGLELVTDCRAKDIGIISASPFGCGLLTGGSPPAWHPANEQVRAVATLAARFCVEHGTSIAKLALQFSSQNTFFPTTMFSTARSESVLRNVAWHAEPIDQDLLAEVRTILAPVIDKQWDFDAGIDRMKAGSS
ncbi:MAG: L-galactose dehydrogenase [Rhodothermales bacterium]|jgi:L-galactose dehydrogenase